MCWSDYPNLWRICYLFVLHLLLVYRSKIDSAYNTSGPIIFSWLIWIHSFIRKYFLCFCKGLALLGFGVVRMLLRNWFRIWRTLPTPACLLMLILAINDLYCMLRVRNNAIILTSYWRRLLCPQLIALDYRGCKGLLTLSAFYLRAEVHLLLWTFLSRFPRPIRFCWNRLVLSQCICLRSYWWYLHFNLLRI